MESSKSKSKEKPRVIQPTNKPGTIVNARKQNIPNVAPVKEVVILTD